MATTTDTRPDVREAPAPVVERERPAVTRRIWRPTVGPGMLLGALGSAGVILSLFLPWRDPGVHTDHIPLEFLWHHNTTAANPSLLLVLIPIAVVMLIGTFAPLGSILRLLAGVAALAVCGIFAYQLDRSLFTGQDLGDVLASGFYAAAIGGFLSFFGGFVPGRWFGRREVTTY